MHNSIPTIVKWPWRAWILFRRISNCRTSLTLHNLIWLSLVTIVLHPVFRVLGAVRTEANIKVRGYNRPFRMRIGTTDPICFLEVILENEYKTVVEMCDSKVGIILDLGSNVGYSLRYFMERFSDVHLIGVEPNDNNFDTLYANINLGPNPERVIILKKCASGRRATVHLDTSRGSWEAKIVESGSGQASIETVDALTIPELLELAGHSGAEIALLKCDIEGAEEALLDEFPGWLSKTRVFVIESHRPYWATQVRDTIERHFPGRYRFILENELVLGSISSSGE